MEASTQPSEYSLASRRYLHKQYNFEDKIKFKVNISEFNLGDIGYKVDTYMVLLWLQTEHTSANRVYISPEEEMKVLDEVANKEGEVIIDWEGTEVKLLGYYKEPQDNCLACGGDTKTDTSGTGLPTLGLRVYILGSEGGGWVEYGNAVVQGKGGITPIVNKFLATETGQSTVGSFNVSLDVELPVIVSDEDVDLEFASEDASHWQKDIEVIRLSGGRAVTNVLEPKIGYGVYVIPRAYFFLPGYRPFYFNPSWLEALISYSFKIHQVEALSIGEGCNGSGLPETEGLFRAAMIAFVHGLTFFVTRFIYQPDKYPSTTGPGLEVEIYSKDVLTLGAGDCEDVAYLLQQMCLAIKRSSSTLGVLGFCSRMLQYYIPVHCLVQAVAPKMPTHLVTDHPVVVEYGLCHLEKAQNSMSHYHVVCILIPTRDTAKFFARAQVGLKPRINKEHPEKTPKDILDRLTVYKEKVKENRKLLGLPEESNSSTCPPLPKYHKLVTRLIMEGTSSIHADHLRKALTKSQVETLGAAVERGEEPIKGYTFQNFEGGSIMYGAGVQFASEEFLKVSSSPLATVVVNMEDGCDYLGPMEYMFSYKSYAKNIKLVPGLETPVTTPIPAWYDPPTPVLTVDRKKFDEELKKMPIIIQYPEDAVIGTWSTKKTSIPYLPWNLTTPEEVAPQYLSGLKTT